MAIASSYQLYSGTIANSFGIIKKDEQNLEFYRLNALPQAELLLKNSQRGFQEGEIEYLEYIQGLSRALNIQTKHLAFINQFNQTLIKIEQLTTNN